MSEQQLNNDPELSRRLELLEMFSQSPEDDQVWDEVYELVRESDRLKDEDGIASDIPADELIRLAQTVRNTPPEQRYDLMANSASNGRIWFDVLETFRFPGLDDAKKTLLDSWINETYPPKKFEFAIDLGTGTGESLNALEANSERVVGVDRNRKLLEVASGRKSDNTQLVEANVTDLPFENSMFDIATSSGLTGSLDRNALANFYRELARILRPGGFYLEISPWVPDHQTTEQDRRISATPRGVLADMITDTVSGKHSVSSSMEVDEFENLMYELRFYLDRFIIKTEDHDSEWLVTLFTKSA